MPNFSIIVITYKRKKALDALLSQLSTLAYEAPKFVVINGEDPVSYNLLKEKYPEISWLNGNFKTPGLARNHALKEVATDWTLFLDDDVLLPDHYFKESEKIRATLAKDIVCVGGPDHSPTDGNIFQDALSLTLRSPMATAHTRLRHQRTTKEITQGHESNLILCHLWLRMSFQRRHQLYFTPHLFRNEENYLINQITLLKGKALYCSSLFAYHYRKTRPDHLAKAVFSSGYYRVKSFSLSYSLFNFLFLIPALWVLYLFLYSQGIVGHHLLIMYISLTVFISLKMSNEQKVLFPLIIAYQILINFFYGLGILWGLLKLPFWLLFKRNL